MWLVAHNAGPTVGLQSCIGKGQLRGQGRKRDVNDLVSRVRLLEQQVETSSREREDHFDIMEEKQRTIMKAQVEIEHLRKMLQAQAAEIETLKQNADKKALLLIKSKWRNKLDELARLNSELISMLRFRDERITELQQLVCARREGEKEGAHEKLLDNITALTADLMQKDKLMYEKNTVIYSYESRLERAEQAALSALASQCSAESRLSWLLKERGDMLNLIKKLIARSREPKKKFVGVVSADSITPSLSQCTEKPFFTSDEESVDQCSQKKNKDSLLNLLLLRLPATETWAQMKGLFAAWLSFVIQRNIARRFAGKQEFLSSVLLVPAPGQEEEARKNEFYVSHSFEEKRITELRLQLEAVEDAMEGQQKQFNVEKEEWTIKMREMAERIDTLERQLYVSPIPLPNVPSSRIDTWGEQQMYSGMFAYSDSVPLALSDNSDFNIAVANSVSASLLDGGKVITSIASVAEEKSEAEIEREKKEEKAVSTVISSLVSLKDASEVAAVIETLLLLHRQGIDTWRTKAFAAQERAKKAENVIFVLSGLLYRAIMPHIFDIYEICVAAMEKKVDNFIEAFFCMTSCVFKYREVRTDNLNGCDERLIALGSWHRWRLYVELARAVAVREKMSRTVAFMSEQNEQLKVLAKRAVMRLKVLEGFSSIVEEEPI